MNYFVTGATGFIGRFLVARLLERGGTVHVLMRESSAAKFQSLKERLDADDKALLPVWGDITQAGLVKAADGKKLKGKIDQVFHLAAVYDMNMDDETADRVNNEGTRNLVNFVNGLGPKVRLNHVSSVAVAGGEFDGTFSERMFDEGQSLKHPYFRTKYESEKIVRDEAKVPYRIYRPGAVIGSSESGEMDKVDGPYYFFKTLQRIRDRVPKWLPLLGIEGGTVPLAPVDYVVDAMDHIAHLDDLDGKVFHLMQTPEPTVGELMSTMMRAAHGPGFAKSLDVPDVRNLLPELAQDMLEKLPTKQLTRQISRAIGMPVSVLGYVNNKAIFDDRQTRAALKGSGISCPKLDSYADKIWQYWELHLDHEVKIPARLLPKARGKVVMITGASSGIGFAAAKKLGGAGARLLLVARGQEKLEETKAIIEQNGGLAWIYPTDLSDLEAIDKLVAQVLEEHGHVDILVNNAGRSIRRAVFESFDRFHDFERTMQLNYFGAIRLIMGLLPAMAKRRKGHVINISSIGCLANVPRFAAYVASKSALDAYSRCLSGEVKQYNIELTTIYMPLVRTPMIAPTRMYDYVPTLTPEEAADMIVKAVVDKPKRMKTSLGQAAELSYALWPKMNDFVLNKGFQLFPSSAAAKGGERDKPSRDQIAFATLFRGAYW